LVRGKSFPAAKEIEEGVAVLDEDRAEYLGFFGNPERTRMRLGIVTTAVTEQDGWKRTGTGRRPEKGFEV